MRCALLLAILLPFPARADDPQFRERVWPLLDRACVKCHGGEKQKGGLRLDSRAAALKGGDTGPAVVPGKPEESLLIKLIRHAEPDRERMPPKEKLANSEIAALENWIRDGAAWPEKTVPVSVATSERIGDAWTDPRNPILKIFGGQRLDLWSLKPLKTPEAPTDIRSARGINPIDAFILTRLQAAGLELSPEADRRTLARRLTFDLTGLPPSPEEVQAFAADDAPDAYEHLVARLLASPRYGEHQARAWLDVVRYSDSNGFDWDEFRPKAWRFRDYVIRALNGDKPFDQFIREQLAGDELLAAAPRDAAEQDALIATGYLRLGPHDNSAGSFNEQDRSRAELLADLTETTGAAFLGLTMSCCRCHDHKFDPLSQADHFRLRAFFEPVKFADDLPLDLASEQAALKAHNAAIEQKLEPLRAGREALLAPVKKRLREELTAKLTDEERRLLALSKEQRAGDVKAKYEAVAKKIEPQEKAVIDALEGAAKTQHEELTKNIETIKAEKRAATSGLLMTDAEGTPPSTKIHHLGDYKLPREPVEPGFISALDPNPALIAKGANPRTAGRRLTLANWIASPNNPLTARVIVNRIWQGHFGRALVATPNDFGLAGAAPTHPELLDWLASEFVAQGWSLKKLHQLIVTSATYRQASSRPATESTLANTPICTGVDQASADAPSTARGALPEEIDADNALLWRQNLRRLTAEQLRDALLAVAGRLQESKGGPPIWPELPPEIAQANPAFLDDNAEKTKGWYPSPPEERNVRSIFFVQKRTVRVPFMETFDLPENSTSCARRSESTVAPQALALLNSADSAEAARAFASRVEAAAGEEASAQVGAVFAAAFQREPSPEEHAAAVKFLQTRSLVELTRALLNSNEFFYID